MLVNLLFGCYFTGLVCFLFFVHPLFCCAILVMNAIFVCGILYLVMGFSWYVLIFGLVYIGGVYVLLVFASFSSPSVGASSRGSLSYFFCVFLLMLAVFSFSFDWGAVVLDRSDYLCDSSEGVLYCFFSVLLLVGFVFVSLVSNSKDSFFR